MEQIARVVPRLSLNKFIDTYGGFELEEENDERTCINNNIQQPRSFQTRKIYSIKSRI